MPRTTDPVPFGVYTRRRILDADLQPLPANVMWNDDDWSYVEHSAPRPEGVRARFCVSLGAFGMDLIVEVTDPVHIQDAAFPDVAQGDSVQFGIDADGTGALEGQTEFIAALTADGPVLFKTAVASLGGGIPDRWSPAGRPLEHGAVRVVREGHLTRYLIRLQASELYPYRPDTSQPVRMAIRVHHHDGDGRTGVLQWSEGLDTDGRAYGILNPRQ